MKTDLVVSGYLIQDGKLLLIHHKKLDKWLPPGGHIDENETPDDSLVREFKEEVGLDIELVGEKIDVPLNRVLAVPFYVEVHNVGDHDHCCFFYLCALKENQDVNIKLDEVKDYKWFSKEELNDEKIPADVRVLSSKVFEILEKSQN
ncbi:NUDIX hydrolase [Nanoarchaeota archaeon]